MSKHIVTTCIFLNDHFSLPANEFIFNSLENFGFCFRLQPEVSVLFLFGESEIDFAEVFWAVETAVPKGSFLFEFLTRESQQVLLELGLVGLKIFISLPHESGFSLHRLRPIQTHVHIALNCFLQDAFVDDLAVSVLRNLVQNHLSELNLYSLVEELVVLD